MKNIDRNGFTIIELLIAISLIGILFGISISAINRAREKGMDETIASYFASIKTQSERYYNKYGKFSESQSSSVCDNKDLGYGGTSSSGLLFKLQDLTGNGEINTGNEIGGSWNTVTCHARSTGGVDAWVVEAPTTYSEKGAPEMYCIDSTTPSFIIKKNVLIPAPLGSNIGFSCIDSE